MGSLMEGALHTHMDPEAKFQLHLQNAKGKRKVKRVVALKHAI